MELATTRVAEKSIRDMDSLFKTIMEITGEHDSAAVRQHYTRLLLKSAGMQPTWIHQILNLAAEQKLLPLNELASWVGWAFMQPDMTETWDDVILKLAMDHDLLPRDGPSLVRWALARPHMKQQWVDTILHRAATGSSGNLAL